MSDSDAGGVRFCDQVGRLLGRSFEPSQLERGHWECPDPDGTDPGPSAPRSPTGKCVYDSREDSCLDNCLFCGLPDERK